MITGMLIPPPASVNVGGTYLFIDQLIIVVIVIKIFLKFTVTPNNWGACLMIKS